MRVICVLSAIAGVVSAAPQFLPIAAINALPSQPQGPGPTVTKQSPTYNPTVAAQKVAASMVADPLTNHDLASRRDMLESRGLIRRAGNCQAYSQGYAPKTFPDTAQAFLSNPVYTQVSANASTPEGYVSVFQNLNASVVQPGYMGVITYQHYNTIACQRACDAATGCTAFNMYVERSPSKDAGAGCPDPAAVFNYRCTLWGQNITAETATYDGHFRGPTGSNGTAFHNLITASNGYIKHSSAPSFANFTQAALLAGAISEPSTSNAYIGTRNWVGIYDPSLCASACQATTAYHKKSLASPEDGSYTPCNYFNSYVMSKNGVPQGTTCAFFSSPIDAEYATNVEEFDALGNKYTVGASYGYALLKQDSGLSVVEKEE